MTDLGGPALPVGSYQGMSLRDYFAAQLFPALLSAYLHDNKCGIGVDHAPRNVAAHAYAYADAMLAERSKA